MDFIVLISESDYNHAISNNSNERENDASN